MADEPKLDMSRKDRWVWKKGDIVILPDAPKKEDKKKPK